MEVLHTKLEAAYVIAATKGATDDDRALVFYLEGIFRAIHDSLLDTTGSLLSELDQKSVRSLGQMLNTILRLRGGESVLDVAAKVRGKHHI